MFDDSPQDVHVPLSGSSPEIRVRISEQTLEILRDGAVRQTYPISSSQFGTGSEPGSFRTPLGRFAVAEKIGAGAVPGTVFKGRRPTGEIAAQGGPGDLILTRILWLEGRDPENANTKERYIYIHGTNHESEIGKPASQGCLRMRGGDLVALFEQIPVGTPVQISA